MQKMPNLVLLGLNTICNYDCIFCNNSKVQQNNLSLSQFLTEDVKLLIKESGIVDISGYGEIIANNEFKPLISLLTECHRKFSFSTNGSLLTKETVDFLNGSSLYLLNVSLNSLNADTYKFITKNGNLEIVLNNLKYLFNIKRNFKITVSMVLIDQTYNEIMDFINYTDSNKIDKLKLLPLTTSITDYVDIIQIKDQTKYKEKLLEAKKKTKELNIKIQMPNPEATSISIEKTNQQCKAPWIMVGIDSTGNVLPCCWLSTMIMGNIKNEKFASIWNNEKYENLRTSIENKSMKYCKHCLEFGG